MTDALNSNVSVITLLSAAPVDVTTFGSMLLLTGDAVLGGDDYRTYQTPSDVDSDTDQSATTAAALKAALAQSPRPDQVVLGPAIGQASLVITVGGTIADNENFTITLNGDTQTYNTTVPADDATAVAAGLVALLTPPGDGAIGNVGPVITITGTVTDWSVSTDSAAGTIAGAATLAGADITALNALLLATTSFYTVCLNGSHGLSHEAMAAYWETAGRFVYFGWTLADEVRDNDANNLAARLKAVAYERTCLFYQTHSGTEYPAVALAAVAAGGDPDVATTTLAYKKLTGVSSNSLTSTQLTNLETNYVTVYSGFFGQPAVWRGKLMDGQFFDIRQSIDWSEARIEEAIAQLFLDVSRRGLKIPYSDPGIQQVAAVVDAVLRRGVSIQHFAEVLDDNGIRTSPAVNAPRFSTIAAADVTARLLRLSYQARLAGAIDKANVTGYVTISV